ncbi:MAG: DUF3572 family protein [Proteobacteria bacterium]|nr:DUF3572 family protein [Pseudomonadota bacterium]
MQPAQAEIIAIHALQFVMQDETLCERFMAITGLTPTEIQNNVADSGLHLGALEFLLQHEPDAAAFCEATELPPGTALVAQRLIGGEPE